MAGKKRKTIKTEEEKEIAEILLQETDEKEEKKKEKEVLELNPLESLVYEGMRGIFVGSFMIGDLLGFYNKKDGDD